MAPGLTLSHLGKHEAAVEEYTRCIKARELSPRYGPAHVHTWAARVSLGSALVDLDRFSKADVPLLRDSCFRAPPLSAITLNSERVVRRQLPLVDLEHAVALLQGARVVAHGEKEITCTAGQRDRFERQEIE